MNGRTAILCVLLPLLVFGGCRDDEPPAAPVAASNSLLEAAARDLLGDGVPILRLAEPGMCPGHFDIRPSQVRQLRSCRVLLRMSSQDSLDAKLGRATDDGLRIAPVRVSGGLCVPATYLDACRQTADALVRAGLLDRASADARLEEIAARMERLTGRCRERAARLNGVSVLASAHQQPFCTWLGLRVVGTFRGADTEGSAALPYERGKAAGVRLVVANRPEGRRAADFLAGKLGADVVVLGNFPALDAGQERFDDLVEQNLDRLLETAAP